MQALEKSNQSIYNSMLDVIQPTDLDLAGDTFNPSTVFDDKTQAEWFGNIIYNDESRAIKAMHQGERKLSKWVYVLLVVVGCMIGFIAALWFTGAFSGVAGPASSAASQTPLPPAPAVTPYVPPA